jgi:hypothetical protein
LSPNPKVRPWYFLLYGLGYCQALVRSLEKIVMRWCQQRGRRWVM